MNEGDYREPTSFSKSQLPIDVRLAYNEVVELHQAIVNYEAGVIGEIEFIEGVRQIKKTYYDLQSKE